MAEIFEMNAPQEGPKFDSNKKYSWSPNDTFILSGSEFGIVLNSLRGTLATQEAARILLANEAHNVIEGALAKAVEAGIVKEMPEENK